MKLLELKYGNLIKDMKFHFIYISKKYFKDEWNIERKYNVPYPQFKIKSNLKQVGVYVPSKNMFILNLDFASEPELIKATMYHEVIHYYQIMNKSYSRAAAKIHGYHDDYFKEKMKEINSGEGKKYVTIKGQYSDIKSGKAAKPFWVYVIDKDDGYFNWMWTARKNEKLIEQLQRMLDYHNHWKKVYIFETDVVFFKEGVRAGSSGSKLKYAGTDKNNDTYKKYLEKEFISSKKEILKKEK